MRHVFQTVIEGKGIPGNTLGVPISNSVQVSENRNLPSTIPVIFSNIDPYSDIYASAELVDLRPLKAETTFRGVARSKNGVGMF